MQLYFHLLNSNIYIYIRLNLSYHIGSLIFLVHNSMQDHSSIFSNLVNLPIKCKLGRIDAYNQRNIFIFNIFFVTNGNFDCEPMA